MGSFSSGIRVLDYVLRTVRTGVGYEGGFMEFLRGLVVHEVEEARVEWWLGLIGRTEVSYRQL
jgi:hypothetical protein